MIEAENLRSGYAGREILHGVSLEIREGKLTSIIGPNGCGKSTLLKTVCGLLPGGGGVLRYDGKPKSVYTRKEFARLVSVLPQARDVPSLDVETFVSHGRFPHLSFSRSLTDVDFQAIEQAMKDTGTLSFREKNLRELSGGERQRAYLAMTLAQGAKYLFLDEPTTYLDVSQKYEIMELARQIRDAGKTVVMVLHDLSLAFSYSDEIAVMEQGKLLCSGPAGQVFDSGAADRVFGCSSAKAPIGGREEYVFYK